MKSKNKSNALLDEMSIVDVFTRLIFDAECELSDSERLVIELLGQADDSIVSSTRRDISEYLRAMGVDEMIRMVNRIKQRLDQQQDLIAAAQASDRALHPRQ